MDPIRREVGPGVVQVTLDPERWYIIDKDTDQERYYPSATWILDHYPKGFGFKKWLATLGSWEEGREIMSAAGDRGSHVHNAIESLLKNETIHYTDVVGDNFESYTQEEWRLILYFVDWWKKFRPLVVSIEQVVWNDEWGYAGTADLICQIDTGLLDDPKKGKPTGKMQTVLIDWKTSANVYETHKMQVSAYKECVDGVDRCFILHLGTRHKSHWNFVEVEDADHYFGLFESTLNIFRHEIKQDGPRFIDVPTSISLLKEEVVEDA